MSPIKQLIETLTLTEPPIDTDALSLSLQSEDLQSYNSNDAILARCFSYAIKLHYNKPITKEDQQNLHLSPYSTAQCVALFLEHFPILSLVKQSLIDSILTLYGEEEEITLFDTGFKTGGLLREIISALYIHNPKLHSVTIIACEPSKQLLGLGQRSLQDLCTQCTITLSLLSFNSSIDKLNAKEWDEIQESITGPLIITALLSLHHCSNDTIIREQMTTHMNVLNPASLYIAEPDVDHITIPYPERIKNCYTHFKGIFDYIDTLKHLTESVRLSIKEIFVFEIIDIIGNKTEYIREGHNTAQQWLDRLIESGFTIQECSVNQVQSETDALECNCVTHEADSYTSIAYKSTPLLAVMHCTIPQRRR
ncbi:MAG: GRAS family protein [Fibrobacterales bacterium]